MAYSAMGVVSKQAAYSYVIMSVLPAHLEMRLVAIAVLSAPEASLPLSLKVFPRLPRCGGVYTNVHSVFLSLTLSTHEKLLSLSSQ